MVSRPTGEAVGKVTNEEITRAFIETGWEIRYRGGNSICSTPSSLEMIIADCPRASGDSNTPWLESPARYSIAAYTWRPNLSGGQGSIFELYDAKREATVGVRQVPTPQRAVELLARYGVPESEVWGTSETVVVPQEAE